MLFFPTAPIQRSTKKQTLTAALRRSRYCCARTVLARGAATAVPQLLYPETTVLKWHFPQGNATLHEAGKGT
jgi:hypothetical protein